MVVPPPAQQKVFEVLHSTHPGISWMKGLARSFVWWPEIDAAIEQRIKNCVMCQESQKSPAKAPLHLWDWPEHPWSWVHVGYTGPIDNHMFLTLVDAHSKWLEVIPVRSATTTITIDKLQTIFATHGVPEMLVTDNGTVFTSHEFREFAQRNAIPHVTTSPYHSSCNGLAEELYRLSRLPTRKMTSGPTKKKVAQILFHYHLTLHLSAGCSPAKLIMDRRPCSLLDPTIPKARDQV